MSDGIIRVKSAPGLAWKKRRGDNWEARWQARETAIAKGFKVKSVKLWTGTTEPTLQEWKFIADTCTALQQEMLVHEAGGLPTGAPKLDGTLAGLLLAYQQDPDSTYRKLRFKSRQHYDALIKLIKRQYGEERLANIKARTFLRWHEGWASDGKVAVAHGKIGILRTAFGYGKTILEDEECARLSAALSDMRFPMPKARTERLTAAQADAIRAMAHVKLRPSLALAQAFQFEGILRQKDVIGEWVPISEAGSSDVLFVSEEDGIYEKWLRGIRWTEIDTSLILKHVTSKRQKEVVIDLKLAPMIMDEFRKQFAGFDPARPDRAMLPASGPVIISEWSELPWTAVEYRRWWRRLADECGVPREVRNMDSRAGGITEASDAGAGLEDIRHAATHSNVSMTARYSRGTEEKIAKVMQLRVEHRTKNRE